MGGITVGASILLSAMVYYGDDAPYSAGELVLAVWLVVVGMLRGVASLTGYAPGWVSAVGLVAVGGVGTLIGFDFTIAAVGAAVAVFVFCAEFVERWGRRRQKAALMDALDPGPDVRDVLRRSVRRRRKKPVDSV